MSPARRRLALGLLFGWVILSPVAWALWQWQGERSARSASGLRTSLTDASTCAQWKSASRDDRRGLARRIAVDRGWTATFAAGQVEQRLDEWCVGVPDQAVGGFSTVPMALTSDQEVPGGG